MNKLRFSLFIVATVLLSMALCSTAQAQQRVFVSGVGSDANPCTRTAPCRNFQRGHDAVLSGGEVVALDSAGYGQLTITKSVTITGEGVYAGITASSLNGVAIATAGITVILRSLTIEGLGSGDFGIVAANFTVLHIEKCIVNGFAGDGMIVQPSAAGTRKVFIKDSIFRNNAGLGIRFNNGSGTALLATVEGTRTENNNAPGIRSFGSGTTVTARDCLSSRNSIGFVSQGGGVLNIESSVASNNSSHGIEALFSGTVRVSNSTVTNNAGFGFNNDSTNPGTFESRGNNTVAGNNGGGAQTDGTITPITGT